jgi:hypothetical protein
VAANNFIINQFMRCIVHHAYSLVNERFLIG